MRWPRGFRCPRCNGRESSWIASRALDQCGACRYQASLTAGTVLHKPRVPLRTWLLAVFFVARHKQSISALQLQRDVGIESYKTAWLLLNKLRAVPAPDPGRLLSGRVEADESYLGAPHEKSRRGGWAHGRKTLVGAVVERRRGKGHLRLDILEIHTFEGDLGPFVRAPSKAGIERQRIVVGSDRSRAVKLFRWGHAIFSNQKSWLRGTYHGVSREYLPRYLDESTFRFNHRDHEDAIAQEILRRAVGAERRAAS